MEEGSVPSSYLVKYSSELATNQDFNLAETCLVSGGLPSGLTPMDNPVSDPFALVTDHHIESKQRGTMNWSKSHKESVATGVTLLTPLADSKGDLPLRPKNKPRHVSAKTALALAIGTTGEGVSNDFEANTISNASNNDALKMSTRINLHEAGPTLFTMIE